jgi:Fe-S cluster biogenesis protein NfuA
MNEQYNKVKNIIDRDIKNLIQADGGKIELISVEDGNVLIRLFGACSHCSAVQFTLKYSVEKILKMKLPEIKSVSLKN